MRKNLLPEEWKSKKFISSFIAIVFLLLAIPITVFVVIQSEIVSRHPEAATPIAGFKEQTVATGFNQPTAFAFAPDGRIFVAQKGGAIRIIKNGVVLANSFHQMANISTGGERGLLGITFDPNFTSNNYVYVFHSSTSGGEHQRVSRLTANGDVSTGTETLLFRMDTDTNSNHNGGGIHFGNDGKLYFAQGEDYSYDVAQRTDNYKGKIMRINPVPDDPGTTGVDERIPSDNPTSFQTKFGTQTPTGAFRAIWAVGFRNPYTFAVDPVTGRIFVNDVGQNSREEVNELIKGGNYGYPDCEGTMNFQGSCAQSYYRAPFYEYDHGVGVAITGGVFYRGSKFPSDYDGDYLFADYSWNWIKRIDQNTKAVNNFATGASGPVDLRVRDGDLFHLNYSDGTLRRIYYDNAPEPPPTNIWCEAEAGLMTNPMVKVNDSNASAGQFVNSTVTNLTAAPPAPTNTGFSKLEFDVPKTATYNFWVRVNYASAESDSLWAEFDDNGTFYKVGNESNQIVPFNSWHWVNWQEGTTSLLIKVNLTVGKHTLKLYGRESLTKIDKLLLTDSNNLDPNSQGMGGTAGNCTPSGTPPTATISTPATGTTYTHNGPAISYSGDGVSGAGTVLPASAFRWDIDFVHGFSPPSAHTHPWDQKLGVKSGSFIPGFEEFAPDVAYRITLSVTDPATGLTDTDVRDVLPVKVRLTLASNPTGLTVKIDGVQVPTPYGFDSVVGYPRIVEAVSPQSLAGKNYQFTSWSNGGSRIQTITTPSTNTTYTATFTEVIKVGDINGDGKIDILDLSTMLSKWGTTDAACDLNDDGTVGILDLSTLLSKWGT